MEIISPPKTPLTAVSAPSFLEYLRFGLFAECHSLLNKLLEKRSKKKGGNDWLERRWKGAQQQVLKASRTKFYVLTTFMTPCSIARS